MMKRVFKIGLLIQIGCLLVLLLSMPVVNATELEPTCLQLCTMESGREVNEGECWKDGGSEGDDLEGYARSCANYSGTCNRQDCKTELTGQSLLDNGENVDRGI